MTNPALSQVTPPQADKRRASARAGFLLASMSLIGTLALVEIALRVAGFSYRLYPEKIEFGWPNPSVMEDRYLPDNELLWVPKEYPQTLNSLRTDRPELVFMGDSCTEFGTYEKFFAARLEEKGYAPLKAAKVGVGGWTSYQGRQQMSRDIAPLKPSIVTIYYGWNDHWIGFGIQDKDIGKLRSPLFTLLEHSRLTQLLVKAAISRTIKSESATPLRVSEEDFRSNLESIVATAKQNGIIPVLLTAPSSHRQGKEPKYLKQRHITDLSQLVPLHQRYVSIVREVAQKTGAKLCDLAADFAALPQEDLDKLYFNKDGIHLTKEAGQGYDKLAEFLVACFARENLLAKSAGQP